MINNSVKHDRFVGPEQIAWYIKVEVFGSGELPAAGGGPLTVANSTRISEMEVWSLTLRPIWLSGYDEAAGWMVEDCSPLVEGVFEAWSFSRGKRVDSCVY